MKISKLTPDIARSFSRAEEADGDIPFEVILPAAIAYIKNYTELSDEELDELEDTTIAALVLCSDMYDNRQMQVENDKVNRVVSSILDMHRRNLA